MLGKITAGDRADGSPGIDHLCDDPHRQGALDGSGAARRAGRHMVCTSVGPRPIRASHGASREPDVRSIFAACTASI